MEISKPKTKEAIDVDADGDGGVVAWLDDDTGTVMKVSTQIPGVKVQAAENSSWMFYNRNKLQKIDLKMLDTQGVTDISYMFSDCSGLTSLDLTSLDTQKVTDMQWMFSGCPGLTSLDLTPLDTSKVTDMTYMFAGCSGLTSLTTGTTFKFVGTDYELSGTWQNTAGETFTSGKFPSNVADTYTKISS